MEEPQPQLLATLDCCDHVYCFECIHTWVDKSESKCPQCKKEIKNIIHKDAEGKDATIIVEHRHQGMINLSCTECRQRVWGRNLVTGSGPDEALQCDLCEEYACHIRCFTARQREFYNSNQCWLCDLCIAELECEDDEDSESQCDCPNCRPDLHRDIVALGRDLNFEMMALQQFLRSFGVRMPAIQVS